MNSYQPLPVGARTGALSTVQGHRVLRNTYLLLSMTLLFSAATAGFAVVTQAPPMHWLLMLVGMFGLLFLTMKLRNSAWGLASVFAFTGFMGYTLGPVLSRYLAMPGGGELVMGAMGLTGLIFLSLSAYVLVSRRDFSFMGGFLFVGLQAWEYHHAYTELGLQLGTSIRVIGQDPRDARRGYGLSRPGGAIARRVAQLVSAGQLPADPRYLIPPRGPLSNWYGARTSTGVRLLFLNDLNQLGVKLDTQL